MFDTRILIFVRALTLVVASVAGCEAVLAQAVVKTNEQLKELRRVFEADKASAINFFVAKGATGSCGAGCDTWIAAEGVFDAAAPERFQKFLQKSNRAALPIFFSSPGGDVKAAFEIGRLLRTRKMTAAVGWTFPDACPIRGPKCELLMRSGEELPSRLRITGSSCSSACVYALAGAIKREIGPEAKLGVHATLTYSQTRDGRLGLALPGATERTRNRLQSYLREMGIDLALSERAQKVPHASVEYLSREEIVRFKLDVRRNVEGPWSFERFGPTLNKSVLVQADPGQPVQPSSLELFCQKGDITINYRRTLTPSEMETRSSIALVGHNGAIEFPQANAPGEPWVRDTRTFVSPLSFLEAAVDGPTIEIVEKFLSPGAESRSTSTRVSTAGLQAGLKAVSKDCR